VLSDTGAVWTPTDFADLGTRAAIDKTLQRLVTAGDLRRIDRGLYDRPRQNSLTDHVTVPDYRAVIRAVARRDRARVLIDGMTAANDLGLTTAVPARIEVLVDARLKPIRLGRSQEIRFRTAAASRLYWAGRPGMRVVQALYWLQDTLENSEERERVVRRLSLILADPKHGRAISLDLRAGLSALPIWMQEFLRDLISPPSSPAAALTNKPRKTSSGRQKGRASATSKNTSSRVSKHVSERIPTSTKRSSKTSRSKS